MSPVPLRVAAHRHAKLHRLSGRTTVTVLACGILVFLLFSWSLALQLPLSLPSASSFFPTASTWYSSERRNDGPLQTPGCCGALALGLPYMVAAPLSNVREARPRTSSCSIRQAESGGSTGSRFGGGPSFLRSLSGTNTMFVFD